MVRVNQVWIGDLETDGLLDEATTIWCGCYLSYPRRDIKTFDPSSITDMIQWMKGKCLVFHNASGFDIPVIKKLYNYEHPHYLDSLKMSQMMYPDIKGYKSPHSIEAWGERFGRHKPEHEDWSKYTPEMLHRCKEDTEIGWLLYNKIIRERGGK